MTSIDILNTSILNKFDDLMIELMEEEYGELDEAVNNSSLLNKIQYHLDKSIEKVKTIKDNLPVNEETSKVILPNLRAFKYRLNKRREVGCEGCLIREVFVICTLFLEVFDREWNEILEIEAMYDAGWRIDKDYPNNILAV